MHSDLIGFVNGVPNTDIRSVLGYHYITARNPVNVFAVVKQSSFLLFLQVVKMELSSLVSEEEL